MDSSPETLTRADRIAAGLRRAITEGDIAIGDRLPSEAALTREHGVSRPVVREAIAALRSEGLVEARKGAGVYVIACEGRTSLPFSAIDADKLSSIVELLEFRIGVETEGAGLAAARKSPAQEIAIFEALDAIDAASRTGEPTGPADFAFHRAVALAANNPRFVQFLDMLGDMAIPRIGLGTNVALDPRYDKVLHNEHARIADAISRGAEADARATMRVHLESSLRRYRALRKQAAKPV